MGDVDEGDAQLLLHRRSSPRICRRRIFVERRQRLVEQQHPRIGDQRTGQRHALLLAARKLRRQAMGDAHLHLGQVARLLVALGLADAADLEAKATLSSTLRCGNSA